MRCRPSMRMSETLKASKSWAKAGALRAAARARLKRRRRAGMRVIINPKKAAQRAENERESGDQSKNVVIKSQSHQPGQQGQAGVLARHQQTFADRTARNQLDKVIQQVPAIQDRDRQQVHDAQTQG